MPGKLPTMARRLQLNIIQRQTVDWLNLTDEQFRLQSIEFCKLWGKKPDTVWNFFQLWNQTFSLDYREVRQQLKALSLENFQQVTGARFVPYEGYVNLLPEEGYYLFLDDDDWVAPDMQAQLEQQLSAQSQFPHLLLWRSANIGSPNQDHPVFVWGMNGRCMTNNYAVHSSWLEPFDKISQVIQHKDAKKLFEENDNIPHLDCALTVSNKSPVSSVSLDRGLQGDLRASKLADLVERYIWRMDAVGNQAYAYIPWAEALVGRTVEIFRRVAESRR